MAFISLVPLPFEAKYLTIESGDVGVLYLRKLKSRFADAFAGLAKLSMTLINEIGYPMSVSSLTLHVFVIYLPRLHCIQWSRDDRQ